MAKRPKAPVVVDGTERALGRYLLPDEDPHDYSQFLDEILGELSPLGIYQHHIATNLANVEWDILRHRRLLAAVVRIEFRRQAAAVTESGEPGRVTALFDAMSDTSLGRSLLAGDPTSLSTLDEFGVSMSEVTAASLVARRDTVAYHEMRIADLERRRRLLLADYDRLRARKSLADDLDEAVEVE